jgi:hypothetical protein
MKENPYQSTFVDNIKKIMIFFMEVPWYWIPNGNYIGNDDNIESYTVTRENSFFYLIDLLTIC